MQISLRPCFNMLENGKNVENTSLSTIQVWLELYQGGSFVIQPILLRIMVRLRINNKLGKHFLVQSHYDHRRKSGICFLLLSLNPLISVNIQCNY